MDLDADDLVINGSRGLLGVAQHYRVGKFITMRNGGSVAAFSINPLNDHGNDFARYEAKLPPGKSTSEGFVVPQDGRLSFLLRSRSLVSHISELRPTIKLVNNLTGEVVFEKHGSSRVLSSFNREVQAGEYHFENLAPLGANFSMMYSAYKTDLATKEDLVVVPTYA